MKLEVGKKYKTRDGQMVTIVEYDQDDRRYPFRGRIGSGDSFWWAENGGFWATGDLHSLDLVAEMGPLTYADVVRKLHRMLDKNGIGSAEAAQLYYELVNLVTIIGQGNSHIPQRK